VTDGRFVVDPSLDGEDRLTDLKAEMAAAIMSARAPDVYDVDPAG
jgi:hypothetical protein